MADASEVSFSSSNFPSFEGNGDDCLLLTEEWRTTILEGSLRADGLSHLSRDLDQVSLRTGCVETAAMMAFQLIMFIKAVKMFSPIK